jgi:mRNA-degrading endonuclease toxin of MazEF toxin-antitoxin module
MIDFDRWDVVIALFPFTDVPVRKPRPTLVLSGADFNRSHGHVISAMITTGAGSRWPSDYAIGDPSAAGLLVPSLVRWKVFTIPAALIGRRAGALAEADRRDIARLRNAILF